jgi:hypothetical protein
MTSFPGSPRLLNGGIALVNPETLTVGRVIALQYNPGSISRSLQPQAATGTGDRSEALRLTAPAVETIQIEVEFDAADPLEFADQNPNVAQFGIYPQLAVLETILHPSSRQLQVNDQLARSGSLEIVPMQTPLTLFIWSKNRVVPVRLTDYSVVEEAHDPLLNPLRAKVSLGMRILTINDLGFNHRGGDLFMIHLQQQERLAALAATRSLSALGIGGLQ